MHDVFKTWTQAYLCFQSASENIKLFLKNLCDHVCFALLLHLYLIREQKAD